MSSSRQIVAIALASQTACLFAPADERSEALTGGETETGTTETQSTDTFASTGDSLPDTHDKTDSSDSGEGSQTTQSSTTETQEESGGDELDPQTEDESASDSNDDTGETPQTDDLARGLLWSHVYGVGEKEGVYAIDVDASDRVWVFGNRLGRGPTGDGVRLLVLIYEPDGTLSTLEKLAVNGNRHMDDGRMALLPEGGALIFARDAQGDPWFARLDENGQVDYEVEALKEPGYYVRGLWAPGDADFWTFAWDKTGHQLQFDRFDHTTHARVESHAIAVDPDANFVFDPYNTDRISFPLAADRPAIAVYRLPTAHESHFDLGLMAIARGADSAEWQRRHEFDQPLRVQDTAFDPDGNLLVALSIHAADGSRRDSALAKFDPEGQLLWSHTETRPSVFQLERSEAIASDGDGNILLGTTWIDLEDPDAPLRGAELRIYAADGEGDLRWRHSVVDSDHVPESIVAITTDAQGCVYVGSGDANLDWERSIVVSKLRP